MLTSIVLTLISDVSATLPAELGRANYAETLARLGRFAPELAGLIHGSDGPKPITCSGILDRRTDGGSLRVQAGQPYCVRVTGLSAQASEALEEALLRQPPTRWNLGHHEFQVAEVLCDTARHSWSGRATCEQLTVAILERGERLPRQVSLEFSSPTAFRSNEMQVPVPMPGLVFGSLVDRWNAFSPVALDPDVRRFAEERVAISNYRLESQPVPAKGGALRIGGVGRVTYTALTDEHYWLAVFQMLADFAFYSGVGVQTATGMGQCRRVR